ncbi:predicted transporter [Moesziomyces antarcticus T-34]|uniref:Predicted transporter n=1 Tax=Pseudozyma antarctica (strain T-34) TaxID=1151754 RepID=M9MEI2_PSEA3|nr:predicted transporter [Moesziomyces antarcticus T-34]
MHRRVLHPPSISIPPSHCQSSFLVRRDTTPTAAIPATVYIDVTPVSEKIVQLTTAAGAPVEPIWATLMAKALEGKDVKELLTNVGAGGASVAVAAPAGGAAAAGGAAEEAKEDKKEEEKEESDDDMGFGLFD